MLAVIYAYVIIGTNQKTWVLWECSDFCKQVSSVVAQQHEQGIINICSGRPEKLADRVERFIKDNNYNIKLQYGVFPDRPYDSKAIWGDDTKIQKILNIKRESISKKERG